MTGTIRTTLAFGRGRMLILMWMVAASTAVLQSTMG